MPNRLPFFRIAHLDHTSGDGYVLSYCFQVLSRHLWIITRYQCHNYIWYLDRAHMVWSHPASCCRVSSRVHSVPILASDWIITWAFEGRNMNHFRIRFWYCPGVIEKTSIFIFPMHLWILPQLVISYLDRYVSSYIPASRHFERANIW
jgi:hypothetical protein